MAQYLPLRLIPGLLCSARLYAPQIAALWPHGPVMVADHRRDAEMNGIAERILAEAPPRFALAGLSMGGYIAFAMMRIAPVDHRAAGAGQCRACRLARAVNQLRRRAL